MKNIKIILIIILIVLLAIIGLLILNLINGEDKVADNEVVLVSSDASEQVKKIGVTELEEYSSDKQNIIEENQEIDPQERYIDFTIGGTGDIMCHDSQLNDGERTANLLDLENKYSFDHWFDAVRDELQYPDIMIANFETNIVANKKYMGYPEFNSPSEVAVATKNSGIDVFSNANNHAMDMDYEGLIATLDEFDKIGVTNTGIYSNIEEYNELLFFDISEDIRVCVIGASYMQSEGALSKLTKSQSEYAAEVIDEETKIVNKIKRAKAEGADLVVLSLHWGSEYEREPNKFQQKYAQSFVAAGADLIFGHHPHVIQPAEMVTAISDDGKENKALVYWSLGNFISNQTKNFTNSGVIAYANYEYDRQEEVLRLKDSVYIPTYVYKAKDAGFRFNILPASYYSKENDENYPYIKGTLKTYMQESYQDTVNTLGQNVVKPIDDFKSDEF